MIIFDQFKPAAEDLWLEKELTQEDYLKLFPTVWVGYIDCDSAGLIFENGGNRDRTAVIEKDGISYSLISHSADGYGFLEVRRAALMPGLP